MKYCEKCGNELLDEAVMCPKCGCSVESKKPNKELDKQSGKKALGIVCILAAILIVLFVFIIVAEQI